MFKLTKLSLKSFCILDKGFLITDCNRRKRINDIFIEYGDVISFEAKKGMGTLRCNSPIASALHELLIEINYMKSNVSISELYKSGALTDDEFTAKKSELLKRI